VKTEQEIREHLDVLDRIFDRALLRALGEGSAEHAEANDFLTAAQQALEWVLDLGDSASETPLDFSTTPAQRALMHACLEAAK